MNHSISELNRRHTHLHGTRPLDTPNSTPSRQSDGLIRDFFRRGARGEYEGGAADPTYNSIPAWDIPDERPQIVRTPQQQARRAALIRLEAVLLTACLGFLVTAASINSDDADKPERANTGQPVSQSAQLASVIPIQAAQQPANQATARNVQRKAVRRSQFAATVAQAKLQPIAEVPRANPQVAVAPPVSKEVPATRTPVTAVPKVVRAKQVEPKPAITRSRPKPAKAVQLVDQPRPAAPSGVAVQQRSVAAFPDA